MSIIEVKNLSFVYGIDTPFEKKAVEDVSLSVDEGEVIGLIGHTGSGKSTFVQMLNGLIKPTSGQVLLAGRDIWEKPKEIRNIRFKVGMVFQYPEYQLFDDTVYKDISFGPRNKGYSEKEIDEKVRNAARFVGLSERLLKESPFDLSGGEKRRAAIAGIIAMDPDVLVLDEPTAGLDPKGKNLLLAQIMQYHKQRKNTIFIVSHSMEDISRIADRVMVMNKGRLEMLDTPRNIFAQVEKIESMGLRVPQITKIMMTLKERGVNLPDGILTVEQAFFEVVNLLKKEGKI
ncbi:MAG: energy-coupling factor transporter ATPase [Ruminococcus sp.]|nr:energy-coupling factor transporter ATPase [Ruminococcus sp.]